MEEKKEEKKEDDARALKKDEYNIRGENKGELRERARGRRMKKERSDVARRCFCGALLTATARALCQRRALERHFNIDPASSS